MSVQFKRASAVLGATFALSTALGLAASPANADINTADVARDTTDITRPTGVCVGYGNDVNVVTVGSTATVAAPRPTSVTAC